MSSATRRRSFSRTFRDQQGYLLRVLAGRQRPVRFADLPRDIRWSQVSLFVFLAVSVVAWLVDRTWFDVIHYVSFAVVVGLYVRSVRISQREVERWTPSWTTRVPQDAP